MFNFEKLHCIYKIKRIGSMDHIAIQFDLIMQY